MGFQLSSIIIEDNQADIKSITTLLEAFPVSHVDYFVCDSCDSALSKISEYDPDIIFVSHSLNGENGGDTITRLKKAGSRAGFILMTTNGRLETEGAPDAEVGLISKNDLSSETLGKALELVMPRKVEEMNSPESECNLRAMVENAPQTIMTVNREGKILYLNKEFGGLTIEGLIKRSIFDFAPSELHQRLSQALKRVFDFGKPDRYDFQNSILEDSNLWFRSRIRPVKHGDKVVAATLYINDITEWKLTEQKLSRFKTTLDMTLDSVFMFDPETLIFNYINQGAIDHLGYSSDELLKMSPVDIKPEYTKESFRARLGTIQRATGTSQIFETVHKHKDGHLVPVEIFLQYVAPPGGSGRFVAIVRDITDRKHTEAELQKSEASLAKAQEVAHLGNWDLNIATNKFMWSNEIFRILGLAPQEFEPTYETFIKAIHPDDRDFVKKSVNEALYEGKQYSIEHRIIRPDGTERMVFEHGEVFCDQTGKAVRMVGVVQDITERKHTEDRLELATKVFENAIEGVVITDTDANILSVNPAFTDITGYSAHEVAGQNPSILKSNRHDNAFFKSMWNSLLSKGFWQGEIWNRRKNGEAYLGSMTITAIKDEHDRTTRYVSVFHDITELRRSEELIKFQENHDALTGLPNRSLFEDRLTQALTFSKHSGNSLAVVFLGLDRFKNINDTLGHAIGDKLLQAVAERLQECIWQGDTVSRWGGDMFAFLLQNVTPDGAIKAAQKIIQSIYEPFILNDNEIYITASVGLTLYPTDGEEADKLVKNADTAMYRAKEQGKNNYQLFTPRMNRLAFQKLDMENNLRKALGREEFVTYYQPKIDFKSGEVVGMEALVRWVSLEQGFVSPKNFIPLAEETGLIVPLGQLVLLDALKKTKKWHDMGYSSLRVSVNLSARQFQQSDLIEVLGTSLQISGLDPEYLELELTESVVMHDVEEAIDTMRSLNSMGIKLSIDDFGTGYSSLTYLKKFPIDTLKIDQSFVCDIISDPDNTAIAALIISMAHGLNLRVVAEGVETREVFDFLKEHNCDEMQGFLFSRPLSAEDFSKMLQKGKKFKV